MEDGEYGDGTAGFGWMRFRFSISMSLVMLGVVDGIFRLGFEG